MGYLSITGAVIAYLTIVAIVIYQIIQILRVNLPILRKGWVGSTKDTRRAGPGTS